MSKPKTPRDTQVRHRLSGAALLGTREPTPPVMAVDAQPRAGDAVSQAGRIMNEVAIDDARAALVTGLDYARRRFE